jgi:Flp pilus assembly protein TadG
VCATHDDDGAATVEFAIVVLLLLALFFGIVQFGLGFYQAQGASNGVREAARRAAVGDIRSCAGGGSTTDLSALIDASMFGVAHGTPSMTYSPGPGGTPGSPQAGDSVTVTVTYQISLNIVGGLVPGLPPSIDKTASAESRVEDFHATSTLGLPASRTSCP